MTGRDSAAGCRKEGDNMKKYILAVLALVMTMSGCITISGDLPSMLDRPVVKTFSANPAIINPGEVTTLSWTVNGANSVFIDQGVGNVALSGSTTLTPTATTTYTLTANNAAGNSTVRCQVTVRGTQGSATTGTPTPPALSGMPQINYFVAEPAVIVIGGSSMLRWDVTGATNIFISPEVGPVEEGVGVLVSPAQTTKYTLTADNQIGQAATSVFVTVRPAQLPPLQGGNTVDLPVVLTESGSLIKSGSNYTRSGAVCVGDNTMNLPSRAFLSFDISAIPANAVIEETILDLGAYTITGNPVYTVSGWGNMGALEIYPYQYGTTADVGRLDYEFPAAQVGSFKLNDVSGSPMKLDVTLDNAGNNLIGRLKAEGQARCQFRLQFFTTTNWDSKADMVCVESAALRVKYSLPQ